MFKEIKDLLGKMDVRINCKSILTKGIYNQTKNSIMEDTRTKYPSGSLRIPPTVRGGIFGGK